MNSMTGFGRGVVNSDALQCTIEIKTVNSRFCDLFFKIPRSFNSLEDDLRGLIQAQIKRGKVECTLILKEIGEREKTLTINNAFCQQIKTFLVETGFFKDVDSVTLNAVMQVSKDWIDIEDVPLDEAVLKQVAEEALMEALQQLDQMRQKEGENIKKDLLQRIDYISSVVKEIEVHKGDAVAKYENRLHQKIEDLINTTGMDITSDRFLQEVALLVDKTDITEEIVRFTSHVVQLKDTFSESGPIGRKLDFILQEMNREVNTMGSKGADLEITDRVVLLKNELEKIREQVQNIE